MLLEDSFFLLSLFLCEREHRQLVLETGRARSGNAIHPTYISKTAPIFFKEETLDVILVSFIL